MVQGADNIDGKDGVDEVKFDFAVSSANQTVAAQLSGTGIVNVETMTFDVPAANSTYAPVQFSDVGYASVDTVNLGEGDDRVTAAGADKITFPAMTSRTYNLGGGNDTLISSEKGLSSTRMKMVVNGGDGDDKFYFRDKSLVDDGDVVNGGTGYDTLYIDDPSVTLPIGGPDNAYDLSLPTNATIKGVDKIDFFTDNAADSFIIQNALSTQADDGQTDFVIRDGNSNPNTVAFVDATSATVDLNVTAINRDGAGLSTVDLDGDGVTNDEIDVNMGAGNDKLIFMDKKGDATYTIAGRHGGDYIKIDHDGHNKTVAVQFVDPNDGSAAGHSGEKATGYDDVYGFTNKHTANSAPDASTTGDVFTFEQAHFNAIFDTTEVDANIKAVYDAQPALGDNLLVIKQTNLTYDQLKDFDTIADRANVLNASAAVDVTNAATDDNGILIVVQGLKDSAIYTYIENTGSATSVDAGDLKLLAIVHDNATVGNDGDGGGRADDLFVV
jgi:hypothetical protein